MKENRKAELDRLPRQRQWLVQLTRPETGRTLLYRKALLTLENPGECLLSSGGLLDEDPPPPSAVVP